MTLKNIQISAAKGIWASSTGNSQRIRQAFRDVDHVIVIFSASENRSFLGYGKVTSEPDYGLFPGIWGDMSSRLGANFRIHWLKQCSALCYHADHIKCPCSDPRDTEAKDGELVPVRRCRDGQELTSSVGEVLCRFLWQQPTADLLKGSYLEFEPRVNYAQLAIPDVSKTNGTTGASNASMVSGAPLALEDSKKLGDDGNRSRPAPEKLGSFLAKPRVPVGQVLASSSSSLMAAVTEDAHRQSGVAAGAWAPPPQHHPSVWGHGPPPPTDHRGHHLYPHHYRPPEWLPHHLPPGSYPPPAGYYPSPAAYAGLPSSALSPFDAPVPSPGHAAHGMSPFEAHGSGGSNAPPGFWGDQRVGSGGPPTSWDGASAVLRDGSGGHKRNGVGAGHSGGHRKSSRSRSRKKRKKDKEREKSRK